MSDWDKQEKAVAKRRGGKQTRGSGSSWRNKSDVVESAVRWEMKSTGEQSISIKAAMWKKIRQEAILSGRMPALHIQIGRTNPVRLVVISEDDFDEKFPSDVCICRRFSDTGGFRIADLTCPVHGVEGTDPGDGYWDA